MLVPYFFTINTTSRDFTSSIKKRYNMSHNLDRFPNLKFGGGHSVKFYMGLVGIKAKDTIFNLLGLFTHHQYCCSRIK